MVVREIGWEVVDWVHLAQIGASDTCEHSDEPVKGGEFVDPLSDCQLLKKFSAPEFLGSHHAYLYIALQCEVHLHSSLRFLILI